MNHPRAKTLKQGARLRLFVTMAAIAAFSAFLPAAASADITSTVTGIFSNPTPGAHSTYTNIQDFQYGNGVEPQAGTEDLRKWVIDGPAGLIGNPNAVPKEDRCTLAEFQDFATNSPNLPNPPFLNNCPAASVVGSAAVTMSADAGPVDIDLNGAAAGVAAGGIIYLIDSGSDPEIPVTLGTSFPGLGSQTRSLLAPVTSGPDGDFRIRTIPMEDSSRPVLPGPTNAHIRQIIQILNANAGNGQPFLTNPTRCSSWDTYSYVTAWDSNTNADSDPDPAEHPNAFKKSAASSTVPDCTNKPAFPAKLEAKLSTTDRTANPQLDVVVTNSNTPGVDVPKDVTVKLPGAIAADIDAIAVEKLCSIAQRDSETCPASSKVGTVKVDTPFLVGGLSGDVHIVRKDEGGIPNLAIFVNGAIKFRLDGITNYVGPQGAEIETKLTNLPQALFSRFALTIDGGRPDSLLVFRECPTDGSSPLDGPITSSMTGYTDATVSGSDATQATGCYGTPRVSTFKKCIKYKLKFTPRNLLNRDGIMKVEVWVKGRFGKAKRVKVYRKSPFKASVPLTTKRFTSGRSYKYKVRVVYKPTVDAPNGRVVQSRYAKFKKC